MSDAALWLALRGDDAFYAAIEAADPDSFGVSCPCGTYHVGRHSRGIYDARCPDCGRRTGSMESPALGQGPASVQLEPDDGGEPVLAHLLFGDRP